MRRLSPKIGLFLAVLLTVGWSTAPFLWFTVTSFKSPREIEDIRESLLPRAFHGENYSRLVTRHRLWIPIRNSALVAGATSLVTLPLASLAAFAFSRLRFRGRNPLLGGILAVSMFPQVTLAPTILRWLYAWGWVNTYQGLTLPYVSLTLPLAIWILASFFREIPLELEEAARLDGCGAAGTLFRVFFPVAAPAIFTAAILTFIYAWNEFFFAVILVDREAVRTLPVAIALFQGRYSLPWGEVAAASVAATLPLVLLVLGLQRRIISGLTAGAIKG